MGKRIIGRYTGAERGAMVVILAGLHGNEPAGVKAAARVFQLLEEEPQRNPGFHFRGHLLGVAGNLQALALDQRFVQRDMNRMFIPSLIDELRDKTTLEHEERELVELLDTIQQEIEEYQPEELYLLDLHTTTADGIFAIATHDEGSLQLAQAMHAPVITGLLDGLEGTTLHYFPHYLKVPKVVAVTFEAGQHQDPKSTKRATAAIINLLRSVECVDPLDVENKHDLILLRYSKNLPKIAQLSYVHRINEGDGFEMRPGYTNFHPVEKGEWLANDRHGKILAKEDGLLLMPLYQPQGHDGFFVVKAE